jgi:hypothetical protein
MNTNNLEFLKEGLKYMGFGDKLNADLEKNISQLPAEFKLNITNEYNKEKMDYKLDFRKSDQTDMYFFNRYEATLKNEDPTKEKSQVFYVTKNHGVTAKEAFNLLSGRAINKDLQSKEGQPFNAWLQLDFSQKDKNNNFTVKQYHTAYGYDLNATLSRYPIKELGTEEDKIKLMQSLEKGNVQQVTFIKDGKEEKMFIEANPQYKSLNLYDSKMKLQYQGTEKKKTEAEQTQEKQDTKKQLGKDDSEDSTSKKKSKRQGVGI